MQTQKRVLKILERLAKESCTTKQLTLEIFGTDSEAKRRIIQGDIKLLRSYYKEKIVSPQRGRYKFLSLPNFMQNIKETEGVELNELFEFVAMFDSKMLKLFEEHEPEFVGHVKREVQSIYHIHELPFEMLKSNYLEQIKKAIKYRQYVNIVYTERMSEVLDEVQIHRIIYAKGNWYVALFTPKIERYNGYRFLRINFIEELEVLSKTFNRDIQVEHFIENFQSLFSLYQKPTYEVKLHVSKEVMRHFKAKVYLKSQSVTPTDNGIIVTYQVTNNMEVIPLIKTWIPHITVLEPEHLKVQLKKEVKMFLGKML